MVIIILVLGVLLGLYLKHRFEHHLREQGRKDRENAKKAEDKQLREEARIYGDEVARALRRHSDELRAAEGDEDRSVPPPAEFL